MASVGWADGFAGGPLRLGKTQGDQRAPATKKIQKQIKQAKLTPRMEDAIQKIVKFMEAVDERSTKAADGNQMTIPKVEPGKPKHTCSMVVKTHLA